MIKYFKKPSFILFAIGILFTTGACNKNFPNLLQNFNEAKDSPESKDKVLLVIVDGLSGPAMQEIAPAHISTMTRNGLVSFGSLADPTMAYDVTNESVIASLLTGVNSDKNKVESDDISTIELGEYPSIFTHLKKSLDSRQSSFFTSDSQYGTILGKDAEVQIGTDDQSVVNLAGAGLSTTESDLNVVHLRHVDLAGRAASYSGQDPVYKEAVSTMDNQVNSLWEKVKQRPSYQDENWIVIITSGQGGTSSTPPTDFTAYGDSKRHTYTLFYSPKFSRKIIGRPNSKDIPFIGNASRFTWAENNKVTGKIADASKFNMGTKSDWTITLFVKHNEPNTVYNWPEILTKRAKGFDGQAGWNFFLEEGYWALNCSVVDQSNRQVYGGKINDGNWHALTVVINRSGSQGTIQTYTDGKDVAIGGPSKSNTTTSTLDNIGALALGYTGGIDNTSCNISMCNIQIYNRAFTAEEIKKYGGYTHIDESFPFWDDLQGYWPGYDDVNTNVLTDMANKGAGDFKLSGPVSWVGFNELVPFFQPPIADSFYRLVPNAVDVPFMIYQWLGIPVETSWKLDGKSWTPNYTQIRK